MSICNGRPLLARSLLVIVAAVLGLAPVAWGAGTVTNATQADLQAALNGGGTVTFAVGGVFTLTNTIIIAQDTVLDAAGFDVTISGGNAVRLFQVNSNVAFSVNGLTLANGRAVGTNGVDGLNGAPTEVGQDGFGGGILILGGTVALTGCALTNHSAQGGNSGVDYLYEEIWYRPGGTGYGAALCNLGGALSLTNCLLAANSALGGTSTAPAQVSLTGGPQQEGRRFGGAIYSANGRVSLQGVTFQANSASGVPAVFLPWGAGGAGGQGFGGAIYATNSEVLLSSSVLQGNIANGSAGAGVGGALCLDQGSPGVIQLCRFLGNAANSAPAAYNSPGGEGLGGAVFSGAALQISDSTFSSNSCAGGTRGTPAGAAHGGAICSTNTLVINGCTFDNNLAVAGDTSPTGGIIPNPGVAGEGGAIWSSGTLAATNSTWTADGATGGAASYGGLGSLPVAGGAGSGGAVCITGGQATLINVTIAGNGASGGRGADEAGNPSGPSQGGGLYNTNGVVTVLNSIIANSVSGGDLWGTITDGGYNLCSDRTAAFSATGSHNKTNPLLGPLAENGGPTETMAPLPGSPALEAISSGFPPVDQRGVSRPQGPLADIGAYEAPIISTQPQSGTVRWGANVTLTVGAYAATPLAYQWFDDGVAIAGATNSSLSLTNVQAPSAGAYWVQVTGSGIMVTSQQAVLTVDQTPVVVSGPTNSVVSVGGSASFAVLAQGPAPLTYQWSHNDSLIPGATNAVLVIGSAQAGAQGTYTAEISNFAGSVVSPGGQLSFDASGLAILAPPPATLTAGFFDAVTLSVTATGVGPITYQWTSRGTNLPGATNSTFTFTAPAMIGTTSYGVRVTNAYGDIACSVVLEVTYDYTWTTLAGSPGSPGAADGTGSAAQFSWPLGVAVDAGGNVYVADANNSTIRMITPAGAVSTLAGSLGAESDVDGTGSAAEFWDPWGIAVNGVGNLCVSDFQGETIREVTPAGVVTTLAGGLFDGPAGVAVDRAGNMYVADYGSQAIRKITPAGVVTTLAGSASVGGNWGVTGSADGTGSAARFNQPLGVAVDGVGNVYVGDTGNGTIREVTPAGVVTTLAGNPGNLGSADGTGSAARFNQPEGVAVDGVGNLYVADRSNHTIRKITPAGLVTTLAGSPGQPGSAVGTSSVVRFNGPRYLAVDGSGNVYVADTGNDRIVKGVPPPASNLVPGNYPLAALAGQTNSVAVASLLQTWTAPQGDLLAVSAVSPASSQGGVVQLAGSTINYTPAIGFVGADSFTYTVFDSRGASTQGTIAVTVIAVTMDPTLVFNLPLPNAVVIRFVGSPGTTYNVEVSADLIHWTGIGAATAVTNGWFQFIDSETKLSSARFYRTRVP